MSSNKDIIIKTAINETDLILTVEKYVRQDRMTYAEAICEVCKEKEIEPEDIARIVKGPLKAKLEAEAMDRNILERTTEYLI